MSTPVIFFILIVFTAREVMNMITIQKLTNKLMSRNYYDYTFTKENTKTKDSPNLSLKQGLKEEEALREDLSPVENFMS